MKKSVLFIVLIIILISAFMIIQNIPTKKTSDELQSELEEKNKEPAVVSTVENITESPSQENLANKPNLTAWYFADVFEGLRKTTNKINFSDNYTYIYNDDGSFFSKKGPIFSVDPFFEIIYNDVGFEIRFSHFRTYNLGEGINGLEKYNYYIDRVERKDIIDANLTCVKSDECRNIKLIKCSKNQESAYIWYVDTYLFSAYDKGEMLDIFKEFYC